jgi:maltose/moltooligosaccharide transporter
VLSLDAQRVSHATTAQSGSSSPAQGEGLSMERPRQGFWGLWNISFGFFGIQIGFALQNANMSRVFQTLGASMDDLPALWVAAPLTGLLVQPIVGHLSDRTWNRLGRRRPYFLTGAILAALALFMMPFSPTLGAPLLFAAAMLWVLDASLNISMEPFRAFVGDMLRTDQHSAGYAVQTAFIGAGAVVGSIFPWFLEQAGVANVAAPGEIPATVKWSFWAGGAALLAAVLWTVLSTREYSPEEQAAFADARGASGLEEPVTALAAKSYQSSGAWVAAGALTAILAQWLELEKEVLLLSALLVAYGLLSALAVHLARRGRTANMLSSIIGDFSGMPQVMKRLALVQFFSWSALFIMWINTTPVVTQYVFGSTDPASVAYNEGANWVNVLFTLYNGVAAVAAIALLPWMSRSFGKVATHSICLTLGALGFLGFFLLRDATALLLCEVGIGIAWASILSMPYAILASNLPQAKLGIYMGVFNIFIVIPQLLVATVMGTLMKFFFPGEPIWTMLFAAIALLIAAAAMMRVSAALPTREAGR